MPSEISTTSNYQSLQMDLFQFPPHLLKEIVAKLDWKSYFRMQQTCHDMADFIQTNRYVKVFLPFSLHIQPATIEIENRTSEIFLHCIELHQSLDGESLYGTRFVSVAFDRGEWHQVDRNYLSSCCDAFKKLRITFERLEINLMAYSTTEVNLLLKTLKPTKISLELIGDDELALLLNVKHLKDVTIWVMPDVAKDLNTMKMLLATFTKLEIIAVDVEISSAIDIIGKILEHLRTHPLPNLHSLRFRVHGVEIWPLALEEMAKDFGEYDPTHSTTHVEWKLGLDDRHCKLDIGRWGMEISFRYIEGDR